MDALLRQAARQFEAWLIVQAVAWHLRYPLS
jgi:transposase-like protein